MPTRFRDEIGNKFFLGGHPKGYLVAASTPELLESKNSVRSFVECEIKDPTGRFVIPSPLRTYADLGSSGEATVVGHEDEVEIWNSKRWERDAKFGGPTRPPVDDPRAERQHNDNFKPAPYSGNKIYTDTASNLGYRPQQAAPAAYPTNPQIRPHSPFERVGIQQRVFQGSPYIEVEGPIGVADAQKVVARLESSMRSNPRIMFLDLRKVDTIDASLLLSIGPIAADLADSRGRLAIITSRPDIVSLIGMICPSSHTGVLPDLEAAMWWLEDQGYA